MRKPKCRTAAPNAVMALAALMGILWAQAPARPDTQKTALHLVAPCGFVTPIGLSREMFHQAQPDCQLDVAVDQEGALIKRILEKGERPGVVCLAGGKEMERLTQAGVVDPASVRVLGRFAIVLYTRKTNKADIRSLADLKSPKMERIALPDPEASTLGSCVRQSLERLGLWESVKTKITPVGSWKDGYEKVLKDEVDAAFAYLKCPILGMGPGWERAARHRLVTVLPLESHPAAEFLIGATKEGPERALADEFIGFLTTKKMRAVLAKAGLPAHGEQATIAARATGTPAAAVPAGKVIVRGYFPLKQRAPEAEMALFERLRQEFPGKVDAEVLDFTSLVGYSQWRQTPGVTCGGIVVNGKDLFEIQSQGERRLVWFVHGMGGQWTADDLVEVVREEAARVTTASR